MHARLHVSDHAHVRYSVLTERQTTKGSVAFKPSAVSTPEGQPKGFPQKGFFALLNRMSARLG